MSLNRFAILPNGGKAGLELQQNVVLLAQIVTKNETQIL